MVHCSTGPQNDIMCGEIIHKSGSGYSICRDAYFLYFCLGPVYGSCSYSFVDVLFIKKVLILFL